MLLQLCTNDPAPDLQIGDISIDPNPPRPEQAFNVRVDIRNGGILTSEKTSWVRLYLDDIPPR
ncbi:MAG: hypothetical protein ISS56_20895, partial [Anaerolineae bacterium]|nr:hypothetical protein [Anaerolineae bacterium]